MHRKDKMVAHAIYITDQNHESQRAGLPPDAIPGFVVTVYKLHKNGKLGRKPVEIKWNATRPQAEYIAQEYHRQYLTMEECGWA